MNLNHEEKNQNCEEVKGTHWDRNELERKKVRSWSWPKEKWQSEEENIGPEELHKKCISQEQSTGRSCVTMWRRWCVSERQAEMEDGMGKIFEEEVSRWWDYIEGDERAWVMGGKEQTILWLGKSRTENDDVSSHANQSFFLWGESVWGWW